MSFSSRLYVFSISIEFVYLFSLSATFPCSIHDEKMMTKEETWTIICWKCPKNKNKKKHEKKMMQRM
jgi:hypothetical protein